MGPAKFEFGTDFDGARECLCAVLDYVHLCGGGNGGFAGFGNHPCGVGGGCCCVSLLCWGGGVVVAKLEVWVALGIVGGDKFCSCFGPHLEKKPKQVLSRVTMHGYVSQPHRFDDEQQKISPTRKLRTVPAN